MEVNYSNDIIMQMMVNNVHITQIKKIILLCNIVNCNRLVYNKLMSED